MLIELRASASAAEAEAVAAHAAAHPDVSAWPLRINDRRFVVVSGDEALVDPLLADGPAAAVVIAVHSTARTGYWLVDRSNGLAPDQVRVGDSVVGGDQLWWAAGPCVLESVADTIDTVRLARAQGADAARMGLFKPRSSPYHFQGKGRAGLAALAEVKAATGSPVVTEVLDPRDVEAVAEVADCLQVDTRNMTNRALLAELGRTRHPVLLMRGLRSSVTDWLRAAEFVFSRGNTRVILCARGIASFDDSLAFQPDYGAVAALRRQTRLPVIFDPSHCTGRADAVAPAALAAAAFGIDGLLIETHTAPERIYRPGDATHMYPTDQLKRLIEACSSVRDLARGLS